MNIHAGGQVIEGAQLYAERIWHEGASRPGMTIKLDGGITPEQLEALLGNDWQIYDGDRLMGTRTGYNAVVSHELRVVCMSGAEQEVLQANAEKDAAVAEKNAMAGEITARIDDMAAEYDGYFAELLYDMSLGELNGAGGAE